MTHEVPRNPRLLLSTALGTRAVLRGADGSVVELDSEPSGVDGASWVRPRGALRSRQLYTLATPSQSGAGQVLHDSGVVFAARDEPDTTAPQVSDIRLDLEGGSSTCGLALGASLTIGTLDEDPSGALIYVQIDVTTLTGRDRVILPLEFNRFDSPEFGLGVGDHPDHCLLSRFAAHARVGETASAEVTFFDLAGNAFRAEPQRFQFAVITAPPCMELSPARSIEDLDGGAELDAGRPRIAYAEHAAHTHEPSSGCSAMRSRSTAAGAWTGGAVVTGLLGMYRLGRRRHACAQAAAINANAESGGARLRVRGTPSP